MSRDGAGKSSCSHPMIALLLTVCMTAPAATPSLRSDGGIRFGKLVAILAVGAGLLFCARSASAKRQTGGVYAPFRRQYLLESQPLFRAMSNGVPLQAGSFREIDDEITLPVNHDASSDASVSHLLLSSYPAAVSGLVVSIVVIPVDFMARWSRPHVGNECGERIPPAFADFNTASAVIFPLLGAFNLASSDHASPNAVERMGYSGRRIVARLMSHGRWDPSEIAFRIWGVVTWAHLDVPDRAFTNVRKKDFEVAPLGANGRASMTRSAQNVRPSTVERMRILVRHNQRLPQVTPECHVMVTV